MDIFQGAAFILETDYSFFVANASFSVLVKNFAFCQFEGADFKYKSLFYILFFPISQTKNF